MNIHDLKKIIREEVVQALLNTEPGNKMVQAVAMGAFDPFTGKQITQDTDQVELLKKYIQNAVTKELQTPEIKAELGKKIGQLQQKTKTQPEIFPADKPAAQPAPAQNKAANAWSNLYGAKKK